MGPSKGNPDKQNLNAAKKARAKQQAKPPAKKGKGGKPPRPNPALNDPAAFTAPQTYGQALAEGGRVADLTYGPQIAQVQLQQRQAPAWFDQYRAALQTPAQTAAQYAPAIQQQQQMAQQTAQATPGIDPNSQAGQQDALAAKAREALVNLGSGVLQANQQADTTYYQGRQGVANAAQIGANTQLSSQLGSLQGQRGAAVAQYVGQARSDERTYGLAQQHQAVENKAFGVKTQQAADKAHEPNQYGVPKDQWATWSAAHRRRYIAKFKQQTATPSKPGSPQYGIDADKWAKMTPEQRRAAKRAWEAGGKGGKSAFTPEQTSKANIGLRKAIALVQGKLAGKTSAPDDFWQQAFQALVSEKDLDPALARAAVQLVRVGRVGPKTRQALKNDYGISKLPRGSRRKKPAAYKLPKRPPTTPAYPTGGGARPT
jgi:hypothetical protein